jgi:hypothetical protein
MLEIARGSAHLITESRTQYVGSAVGVIAVPVDIAPRFVTAASLPR